MGNNSRILVMAHGHPQFSPGGGEVASYSLFKGFQRHPAVAEAFYLARSPMQPATGKISLHAPNEYLWEQALGEGFFMRAQNLHSSLTNFSYFLKATRPGIIHLHHCVHLGYELLDIIKNTLPDVKIYFTLHEFIPICHNDGQMLKTNGQLCHRADYESCALCFPKKSVGDFWQRKRRFLHYFRNVDMFISPSRFLRDRYVEWGIPEDKIEVLENGLRDIAPVPPRALDAGGRNRYGFFGQITPFKGLPVLLEALALLTRQERSRLVLEVHGANLDKQKKNYRANIERYRKQFEKESCLRWMGQYAASDVGGRMGGIDWFVIPSIWWENSPVTIQEAFAVQRPVLASRLGGMAEKVRHEVDGLLVEAGNPQRWADTFRQTCGNDSLWEKLRQNIRKPVSVAESVEDHLKLMDVIC